MASIPGVLLKELSASVGRGRTARDLFTDVTAEFLPGTVTCILGPSGSGKTTLLSSIAGLVPPEPGTLYCDGLDVGALNERDRLKLRRHTVATVRQDYNLLGSLTARENVVVVGELAGQDVTEAASIWLERLGIAHLQEEFPATLSGGEQQRVAIARALAGPHSVVLADEPTGALDEHNTTRVVESLKHFAQTDKTCIVVSHDERVADAADRVLALVDQGLVECD